MFFKTDDCRSTKYFTLESCANDEAAIRHGQGLLRAGAYSAIEVWDESATHMIAALANPDAVPCRSWNGHRCTLPPILAGELPPLCRSGTPDA